jgi:hypothetical protein
MAISYRQHLGHVLTPNLGWKVQANATVQRLTTAARRISTAAGKKQCHTIFTATLNQQDALSCAPYFMAATEFTLPNLKAMRTEGVEALRKRAWVSTSVDRSALCGPPSEKGCGIEDPEAMEGGLK